MTITTMSRRRFTAQQKAEAVALCLSEGLSCAAVAQRLGLPNSSLAKWVRQARIDRGDFGPPDQGQLTSDERAELVQLRRENRELRREKDFFRLAAAHFAKEQLPPRGFRLISQLSDRFTVAWL
jgi:transposase-like protein